MSEAINKAMAMSKDYPHLDVHQIVFELIELNKKVDALQKTIDALKSKGDAK